MARAQRKIYKIEVLKWFEYQGRNDVKNPQWFRLHPKLFRHPDFVTFGPNDFLGFIFILAECCNQKGPLITLCTDYVRTLTSLRANLFELCVSKLVKNQTVRLLDVQIAPAILEEKRLEEKDISLDPVIFTHKTTEQTLAQAAPARLDFDIIYSRYPRKAGKSRGHSKLKATVKTLEVFNSLSTAVDNYARYCRVHRTETQFIKHWSTFVGEWNDWVQPDASIYQNGKGLTALEEMMLQAKAEQENAAI